MSALLDALGWVGESLDKPGAAMRGLLAGRPDQLANLIPFSDTLGLTDPGQRTSGRNLLEGMGMLDQKAEGDDGFDLGDLAGMGTEIATDPTNFFGGALVGKLFGRRGAALANNATRDMMLSKGAMPEEIAGLTKAVDEAGKPLRTYHGTSHVFGPYDMEKMDTQALYGPGVYTTASPEIASEYAEASANRINASNRLNRMAGRPGAPAAAPMAAPQHVRMQYMDVRNPFNVESNIGKDALETLDTHGGNIFGNMSEFDLERMAKEGSGFSMPGEDVYNMLMDANYVPGRGGSKLLANQVLNDAGYDAITHTGGHLMGGGGRLHQVIIGLDPSKVYAPYIAPGMKDVPRVSPLLAALGGQNALARSSPYMGGM